MKPTLLFEAFLVWCVAAGLCAAADEPCQVHVILFVPADVKAPMHFQERVDEIVGYAESFFASELKRWGHEKIAPPFRRNPAGHVEVTILRGKQKASQYKPVAVRSEVMDANRAKGKLKRGRQVWWIMVYTGEPPAKFSGYLGGFGPEIGGWSVCNFDTTPGRIDPTQPLGSDFLEKLTLKGMLHELGHGFQLPHIGPLRKDNAGNTLMGPTHINYRKVNPAREDRVYLSEAEAALLANHPAFRGVPDSPGPLPRIQVEDLKYSVNRRTKSFLVEGRLAEPKGAVYALVADESDARPGEYWTKTYIGKIERDGKFAVTISEPSESNGTLKTWFAFENGAQTGDGKQRGRESGVAKSYIFNNHQWKFD